MWFIRKFTPFAALVSIVAAALLLGSSAWPALTAEGSEEVPDDKFVVGDLTIERTRGNDGCAESIELTWDTVAGGNYSVKYRVRPWYGWHDVPNPSDITIGADTVSYTMPNTDYSKRYEFTVLGGSQSKILHRDGADAVAGGSALSAARNQDTPSTIDICAPVIADAGYTFNYSADGRRSWYRVATAHAYAKYGFRWAKPNADYVFAYQVSGQSNWTDSARVDAAAKPNAVPSVGVEHKGNKVKFWWSEPDGGASYYNVNYSENGKQSWHRIASNYAKRKATLGSAEAGKSYHFAIQACNSQGCSGWTDSPPAVGSAPYWNGMGPVTLTRSEDAGTHTFTASWDAVPKAAAYHVTITADGGKSWCLLAYAHTGTTLTKEYAAAAVENGSYRVGVRGYNPSGSTKWVNSNTVAVSGQNGAFSCTD